HDHEHGRTIRLERQVLERNDRIAERNRGWFESRGICALNLVSSPGAGKTTLLERSLRELGKELRLHVIEGDQETSADADRIRAAGGRAVQINTGTGCHLDAAMGAQAALPLARGGKRKAAQVPAHVPRGSGSGAEQDRPASPPRLRRGALPLQRAAGQSAAARLPRLGGARRRPARLVRLGSRAAGDARRRLNAGAGESKRPPASSLVVSRQGVAPCSNEAWIRGVVCSSLATERGI